MWIERLMAGISHQHVLSYNPNMDCTNEHFNVDEYYADDGIAPQWRVDKHLGTSIN